MLVSIMTYYINSTPGRLRIQSPRLHDNHEEIKKFEKFIATVDGINKVETNFFTGSALMHYDEGKTSCEKLIGILESNGYFDLMKAITSDELVEEGAEEVIKVVVNIAEELL